MYFCIHIYLSLVGLTLLILLSTLLLWRYSEEKSQSSVNFMQPIDASAAICFGFIHVTRKQAIYWFEPDLGTSVL